MSYSEKAIEKPEEESMKKIKITKAPLLIHLEITPIALLCPIVFEM